MSGSVNYSIDKSSTMDRGEKEERIVDIYITAEAVRDIKHKKEMKECKTTITQTPEHTGSEFVKNRSFRSVSVCLVVLCVLLLTAVIVLCVLIYTNNHQNHIKNKNLTEERDQLLTKYTNITEERDQLLTNYTNITEERDQLLTKYTNITEERDELKTNYNNITKLYEKLKTELWTSIYDGWIKYQFSLYYISSEEKNWTESRRYCTDREADLIIINNNEEQAFVSNLSGTKTVWIGLSDSDVEETWKWVDGSRLNSRFWGSGEPNGNTDENCAESHVSLWNDYFCHKTRKWICEKNISMSFQIRNIQ